MDSFRPRLPRHSGPGQYHDQRDEETEPEKDQHCPRHALRRDLGQARLVAKGHVHREAHRERQPRDPRRRVACAHPRVGWTFLLAQPAIALFACPTSQARLARMLIGCPSVVDLAIAAHAMRPGSKTPRAASRRVAALAWKALRSSADMLGSRSPAAPALPTMVGSAIVTP